MLMLHGEIKVNHREVGYWQAVRLDGLKLTQQTSNYRCNVTRRLIHGGYQRCDFNLTHRYDDGAAVLAAKVLTESERIFTARDADSITAIPEDAA